jgi:hypothetical protein
MKKWGTNRVAGGFSVFEFAVFYFSRRAAALFYQFNMKGGLNNFCSYAAGAHNFRRHFRVIINMA